MVTQGLDVVGEIVTGKKREQHQVWPVFQAVLSQGQIFLRRAIAVYSEADHLDPPIAEGGALRQ